jgi:integrase
MVPGLRRGKTEAPEGRKVLPVELEMVEATLPRLSLIQQDMVRLLQFSGMRPGELVIMRPCDVDRSSDVWEYRPHSHKTQNRDKERVVYLGPQSQQVLRPYLLRAAESYCFSPNEALDEIRAARTEARKTPLSCGNVVGSNRLRRKPKWSPGDRYTTQSFGRAIARACDLAVPVPPEIAGDKAATKEWRKAHRWSPNQLRHSLATRARREFGLDTAASLLGHAQIGVTQQYAEKDRQRAVEAARRIG